MQVTIALVAVEGGVGDLEILRTAVGPQTVANIVVTPQVVDGDGGLGGSAHVVVNVKGASIMITVTLTASWIAGGGAEVGDIVPGHLTVREADVCGESGTDGGAAIVGEQGVVDRRGRTGSAEKVIGADVVDEADGHVFEGPGGTAV